MVFPLATAKKAAAERSKNVLRSLSVLVQLIEMFAQSFQLSRYRFNLDSHASQSTDQFRHFWILLGQLNGFRVEILQLLEHCCDR